jgi:hypothetical protein
VVLGEELKQEHVEVDNKFIADLYRYSRYFVGSYGAGLYCMMRPWESCFLCSCSNSAHVVDGEDSCGMSTNAFLKRTGCKHSNLLYANFEVDFASVSFFVAADHDQKEVILCIRGTFSLADVATDLDGEVLDLTDYGFVSLVLFSRF